MASSPSRLSKVGLLCYYHHTVSNHFSLSCQNIPYKHINTCIFFLQSIPKCEIFAGLSVDQEVLLTHGDSIEELAECCQAVAHSGNLVAAIQHKTLKVYAVQFHPEVDLTDNGADMMRNFLYNVSNS